MVGVRQQWHSPLRGHIGAGAGRRPLLHEGEVERQVAAHALTSLHGDPAQGHAVDEAGDGEEGDRRRRGPGDPADCP